MLNKAKTGALGGNTIKWSLENCKKDAKKYKTKMQWREKSPSAYVIAKNKKWIKLCCKHMPKMVRDKWTEAELMADAKKYNSIISWKKASPGAYSAALDNGLVKKCSQHMTGGRNYWPKERVIDDSKKYKTVLDWRNNSKNAVYAAIRHGVYEQCCEHMLKGKEASLYNKKHGIYDIWHAKYKKNKKKTKKRNKMKNPTEKKFLVKFKKDQKNFDLIIDMLLSLSPEKIILFGSQARGDSSESSDYDLLVVFEKDNFIKSSDIINYDKKKVRGKLPCDIITATADEFEKMSKVKTHVMSNAKIEGVMIYKK